VPPLRRRRALEGVQIMCAKRQRRCPALLAIREEALEEWIKRIGGEELNLSEIRPHLRVPLPPDVKRKLVVTRGDFATLNNRWATSNSETVHTRLKEFPEEWYLYHTLYREARESWSEVPALRTAEDLKARADLRVGDFGAGECLLTATCVSKGPARECPS
jgi:hypothetical protein